MNHAYVPIGWLETECLLVLHPRWKYQKDWLKATKWLPASNAISFTSSHKQCCTRFDWTRSIDSKDSLYRSLQTWRQSTHLPPNIFSSFHLVCSPVLDYLVCGTAILDPRPVAPSCAKEKSSGVGNAVEPGKNNKSLTQRMRISLIFI